ncbi:hypothetical protein GQR58_014272 [Nymphon striatum]|nr:hypothetical protein GQR58_014272 [Nymphon striatum]
MKTRPLNHGCCPARAVPGKMPKLPTHETSTLARTLARRFRCRRRHSPGRNLPWPLAMGTRLHKMWPPAPETGTTDIGRPRRTKSGLNRRTITASLNGPSGPHVVTDPRDHRLEPGGVGVLTHDRPLVYGGWKPLFNSLLACYGGFVGIYIGVSVIHVVDFALDFIFGSKKAKRKKMRRQVKCAIINAAKK